MVDRTERRSKSNTWFQKQNHVRPYKQQIDKQFIDPILGSDPTATPAPPTIIGIPTILGNLNVGQTLTANPAPTTGNPRPTNSFQWFNAAGDVLLASGDTYVVQPADEGINIYIIQTATNTLPPDATAQSVNYGPIGAELVAPSYTGTPVITGDIEVGNTLTVTPATLNPGNPPATEVYQWYKTVGGSTTPIAGEDGTSYTTMQSDVGATISWDQNASNSQGTATAIAVGVGPITPADTAPDPFVPSDWALITGSGAAQLTINILALPLDGGSPITDIEYDINSDGNWISLATTSIGSYTVTMAAPNTEYGIRLRALNAIGAANPSDTKNATSGAGGFVDPNDLDVLVWLTNDATTMYQNDDLTTPVVADGDPIGSWDDVSTTLPKRHAFKSSATGECTYIAAGEYVDGNGPSGDAELSIDFSDVTGNIEGDVMYVVTSGVAFGVHRFNGASSHRLWAAAGFNLGCNISQLVIGDPNRRWTAQEKADLLAWGQANSSEPVAEATFRLRSNAQFKEVDFTNMIMHGGTSNMRSCSQLNRLIYGTSFRAGGSSHSQLYNSSAIQDVNGLLLSNNPSNNYANAFNSTNLTQQSIDDILVGIDNAGLSDGTFDQSGGSAPSAVGQAAISNLTGRGWTVTVTT